MDSWEIYYRDGVRIHSRSIRERDTGTSGEMHAQDLGCLLLTHVSTPLSAAVRNAVTGQCSCARKPTGEAALDIFIGVVTSALCLARTEIPDSQKESRFSS